MGADVYRAVRVGSNPSPPLLYLRLGLPSSIHRTADTLNSRKLPLKIVQPYALGSGLCALLPRSNTPGPGP